MNKREAKTVLLKGKMRGRKLTIRQIAMLNRIVSGRKITRHKRENA